jgi:hypothetical protein
MGSRVQRIDADVLGADGRRPLGRRAVRPHDLTTPRFGPTA